MPPSITNGLVEGVPYSLSRWTDLPICKWGWFKAQLAQGHMVAFDPRNLIPRRWSLRPGETTGLIFWTKNPTNLITDQALLEGHRMKVHVTVTGWAEVEKGAPSLEEGADLVVRAVEAFGEENVTWRFSPVPMVPDAADRFDRIARVVGPTGVRRVYLSFLQENDHLPETRSAETRIELLNRLGEVGAAHGVRVLLCNEDRILSGVAGLHPNLASGVCAPPEDFDQKGRCRAPSEGCGCVLMADPFTINESCTLGCQYCYAADQTLSPKRRNTTRSLKVIQ